MTVIASLVVNFSPGNAEDLLSVELDSRDFGYNNGASNFNPGQDVYYLVSKTSTVRITSTVTTAGATVYKTSEIEDQSETVTFIDSSEITTSYPIVGAYTTKWLGKAPIGNLVLINESTFQLQDSSGAALKGLGVLKIEYQTKFDVYKLFGLPAKLNDEEEYQVIVYISGES